MSGGVWSSVNAGGAWTDHNSNLQLTQFYHGSISPTDPNLALGGSQDVDGDTASFIRSNSGVTVALGAANPQNVGGSIGLISLTGIENLTGSGFDDTLAGNAGNNPRLATQMFGRRRDRPARSLHHRHGIFSSDELRPGRLHIGFRAPERRQNQRLLSGDQMTAIQLGRDLHRETALAQRGRG